ncbi:malate dehydrogenase, partial [Reticulomyxa filosa]
MSTGLSKEDTILPRNDRKTKEELNERNSALSQIHKELQSVRKELLVSGCALTAATFRSAARKYLLGVREEVDYLRQHRFARTLIKEPLRVVITGAAGQVGYALVPLVASGQVLGLDQPLILTLLEIPSALKALNGVAMEIEDGAYPLVDAVIPTTDPAVKEEGEKERERGFEKGNKKKYKTIDSSFCCITIFFLKYYYVDYAILVGGFPRGVGMERKDLLAKNAPIFQSMGEGLQKYAKETCKVLVVANPANTNCLTCSRHATKIPRRNFAALTRLDQNRATVQLAHKLGVPVRAVSNVAIWGNHSNTQLHFLFLFFFDTLQNSISSFQVPDVSHAVVAVDGVQKKAEVEEKWVSGEFIPSVQQRGKAVLEARNSSSAVSAANAIKDAIRDWHFGTPEGAHVALAVYSDGSHYGVAKDIFFSFPVTCKNGTYTIVS